MATIQLGGLATGLDTSALISQMMAVEQRPLTALQTQKLQYQAVSTAFQDLNSKLLSLKSAATTLSDPATFFPRSVSSSDTDVAVATATAGTARGSFSLSVSGLARGSIATASATKGALTDTVAAGTGSFTFKLGATGAQVSVAVDASTTLDQLVAAINANNAGVKASAVNAGTSATPAWKLMLASTGTGEVNDIQIVADGTTLGVANTLPAKDAEFSIAGLGGFKRAANTFSDVLDGVTITLKASSGDTDLSVAPDNTALQANVQAFLDAYNAVITGIDGQSQLSTDSSGNQQPGAFTGDVVPQMIRRNLSTAIATSVNSAFGRLAQIGITTQKDGTLTLDAAKFQQALTQNPQAVSDLVAGTSTQDGIADLIVSKIETMTQAITGTIATRQDSLSSQIADTGKQIDAMQVRLDQTRQMLQAKFDNLELLVQNIQSTGSAMLAQLGSLQLQSQNKSSSSK